MATMATTISKKNEKYSCIFCDFVTSKKTDFNRHLITPKHIRNASTHNNNILETATYKCDLCGKIYNDRTGLWRHNKKCIKETQHPEIKETIEPTNSEFNFDKEITDKQIINILLKQNQELMQKQELMQQQMTQITQITDIKEMILEIVKNTNNITNNNNTTNNTNSHNKAFNLNFFLNETCKDAMNIMDFVDSIKLQLSDLEKIGEVGYTQGISNIITSNLKALDVTQRPVHCTDKKRGIMYIKDENKWEKEDDENTKLKNLIIRVSNKNIKLLPQFRVKYPDYKISSSRTSDKYDKIVLEAMGGAGDNDKEKTDKIIQNISKCVVIDKYDE